MKELEDNDVVKLLMGLSYLSAMLAVDIEEDKASGMERLSLELDALDDLLSQIDEQVFNHQFARQAMLATRITKRVTYHTAPKTMQ